MDTMNKPLLMIVDDDFNLAKLLQDLANDVGFNAQTYQHHKEFKTSYLASTPVAIFMDIVMPDVDGNELIEWLVKQGSETPLVIMSGYNGQYLDISKTLADGRGAVVVATLVKPFSLDEIEKLLTEIMELA